MIEHLVCSGAGPHGLAQLGVVMEYERQGLLCYDKLKKVYGCSAGSMIGMLIVLKIPLSETVEYIFKRPWEKFIKLDFFEMNERGGIVDCNKMKEMFYPLFHANNIPLDITFAQARERSTTDLHIFSTNLSTFKQVDFNSESFPDMPILTGVMLSSCIPPMFTVGSYEGVLYADGGLSDNFPLAALMKDPSKPDPTSILCINMSGPLPVIKEGAPLMDLLMYIITQSILKISEFFINHEMATSMCPHYIFYETKNLFSKDTWEKFISLEESRKEIFDKGTEYGRTHLAALNSVSEAELR